MTKTERTIQPYVIHGKGKQQYLHAFCETRQAERDYRIDRIFSVIITKDSFTWPNHFNPADDENGAFFNFRNPYTAIVVIDPDSGILNPIDKKPIEAVLQTITFKNSKDLFKKLLGMGNDFTIISPEWLRDKFSLLYSKNPTKKSIITIFFAATTFYVIPHVVNYTDN